MEGLTRLVSESMARHGFDRPLDYRRLHWSRWFRCESHHSLLFVPSKPGVFALAEEIFSHGGADAACPEPSRRVRPASSPAAHVETAASAVPPVPALSLSKGRSAAEPAEHRMAENPVQERRFSAASSATEKSGALAPEEPRRLLAVTHFFDADDMAFTLDRMLTSNNPLRSRLTSGRYFVRFVAIEDESQRLSIATALNQWMANTTEKATGIGAHFATSLELTDTHVGATAAHVETAASAVPRSGASGPRTNHVATDASSVPRTLSEAKGSGPAAALGLSPSTSAPTTPQLDSGAATNIHCPSPFPSGF
jgi:hypothetical protein